MIHTSASKYLIFLLEYDSASMQVHGTNSDSEIRYVVRTCTNKDWYMGMIPSLSNELAKVTWDLGAQTDCWVCVVHVVYNKHQVFPHVNSVDMQIQGMHFVLQFMVSLTTSKSFLGYL